MFAGSPRTREGGLVTTQAAHIAAQLRSADPVEPREGSKANIPPNGNFVAQFDSTIKRESAGFPKESQP